MHLEARQLNIPSKPIEKYSFFVDFLRCVYYNYKHIL